MEKTYLLKGLDCPNCAAKIEREVGELPEVERAAVNLMRQTLTVETEAGEELCGKIGQIVRRHEPEAEISDVTGKKLPAAQEREHGHSHEDEDENEGSVAFRVTKLAVGAVIFLVGLLLPRFTEIPFPLRLGIFVASYLILGYDVLWSAVRNLFRGELFDECFLMTVSTLGAFAIGEYPEAAAVMLLYQLGEFLQDLAVDRSRDSIEALMDIRPDSATVLREGEWITVRPEEVAVGEVVRVKPGERIPLDGVVTGGASSVDTAALTGESVPRFWSAGDAALSGCIASDGVLTIQVTREAGESTASKILELMETAAEKKAPAENFITKFARIYTPVVCLVALCLALLPPLVTGGNWTEWIRRGCVTLAISCPCALVISIPLTFFGGIGAASKKGILVKGSAYLEALAGTETVVFDKTGTLTKGVFTVTEILPAEGFTKEELLQYAAMAETHSSHPIARSVTEALGRQAGAEEVSDCREIAGRGVSAVWRGKKILAGSAALLAENGILHPAAVERGTAVYTAVDGVYAGALIIEDEAKEDAARAVRSLRELGVRNIVMLTGDREAAARAAAEQLEVTDYAAGLLPADKVAHLEKRMAGGGKTVFVGDGINDAPVLARADVGVAMGAFGSDAAIEAADVVLMEDEPSKLCDAIRTAKKTGRIVKENICFAIGVKIVFILLGAFGLIGMWAAVFGDVGVMLLAVANAMRILRG